MHYNKLSLSNLIYFTESEIWLPSCFCFSVANFL